MPTNVINQGNKRTVKINLWPKFRRIIGGEKMLAGK